MFENGIKNAWPQQRICIPYHPVIRSNKINPIDVLPFTTQISRYIPNRLML